MSDQDINYENGSLLLKNYNHWTTYLHYNQAYLGRCYIVLNRPGNLDPYTDTTTEERLELELTISELTNVINCLYCPGLFNYSNFRNTWLRCHWHIIPRYENPRMLDGQSFIDKNWGKNYAPYDREFRISNKLFSRIKEDITNGLKSL